MTFNVHRNAGQWFVGWTWCWNRTGTAYDGDHGFYPCRWMAWLAGWVATR